jgi:hypothetical protein
LNTNLAALITVKVAFAVTALISEIGGGEGIAENRPYPFPL